MPFKSSAPPQQALRSTSLEAECSTRLRTSRTGQIASVGGASNVYRNVEEVGETYEAPALASPPVLAEEPDVLAILEQRLRDCAFAGDTATARLLYLALTSRVFPRPVSMILKGHSGVGKNHAVEAVLKFIPEEAYWRLSSSTPKAFVYDRRDFRHRMLIVAEAAGIGGEHGNLQMRTLLSEGVIEHLVTERADDGEFYSREVRKEGPTGLITTTTLLRIHDEDESRLLSVPMNDSSEQIRRVLQATAERSKGGRSVPNFDEWHAFHTWVSQRSTDVAIPFVDELADKVDCTHPRITRAFQHVLTLTKAHALLHQLNRETENGSVVATLVDYGAVRELVEPLIAASVSATVQPEIRETVAVVKDLLSKQQNVLDRPTGEQEGVAGYRVAEALQPLSASATSRRIKAAIEAGYLVNLEERRYQRQILILGDPMPDDHWVLPPVGQLAGTR